MSSSWILPIKIPRLINSLLHDSDNIFYDVHTGMFFEEKNYIIQFDQLDDPKITEIVNIRIREALHPISKSLKLDILNG